MSSCDWLFLCLSFRTASHSIFFVFRFARALCLDKKLCKRARGHDSGELWEAHEFRTGRRREKVFARRDRCARRRPDTGKLATDNNGPPQQTASMRGQIAATSGGNLSAQAVSVCACSPKRKADDDELEMRSTCCVSLVPVVVRMLRLMYPSEHTHRER